MRVLQLTRRWWTVCKNVRTLCWQGTRQRWLSQHVKSGSRKSRQTKRIVEQELSVVVRVASSSVSHVVPHMKNHHGDDSPLVPKGTCCSATSYADNTRSGLSPILGESEGCSVRRARSLHRQHSRRGRMMKKWKQHFGGSSLATTMGWNDARVSSSTPQRMQSNCGLVVNAALQFALYSVGVASKLCELPRHDRAIFFDGGESSGIADNVANTCGEFVPNFR